MLRTGPLHVLYHNGLIRLLQPADVKILMNNAKSNGLYSRG